MNSKDWKFLVLASFATVFIAGCQGSKDEPKSSSSPFAGIWVSTQSARQLDQCRHTNGRVPIEGRLEALSIQNDGQVFRYTNRLTFSNVAARQAYKLGTVDGAGDFRRTDPSGQQVLTHSSIQRVEANHITIIDTRGGERSFTRTDETQLQNMQGELYSCSGGHQGPQPQSEWNDRPNFQPQTLPPQQPQGWRRQGQWGAPLPPEEQERWAQQAPPQDNRARGHIPQDQFQRQSPNAPPLPDQNQEYPPGYGARN